MLQPGRKFSAGSGYRYGFNGKENDKDVEGDGNIYDYGFRIYNSRIGKFLSVDPLTQKYAKYTPYQFAGNKPIVFIDLDGKEEYEDPANDPNFLKSIWDNAVDGLGNLLLAATDKQTEGWLIRKTLEKQGIKLPNSDDVPNILLALVFDIHKENRTFVVTPERTAREKLLELGVSALSVISILPSEGSPFILAAKVSPLASKTISEIVQSMFIASRTKQIAKTFLDLGRDATGKTLISEFEAESGAILEATGNFKLRAVKQGEVGEYTFESGIIGNKSVSGKTIDQIGIPKAAVGKFKMSDFTDQITIHLNNKKGVDFVLVDGRNLTAAERTTVTDYIKKNHAKDTDRIITIGFD